MAAPVLELKCCFLKTHYFLVVQNSAGYHQGLVPSTADGATLLPTYFETAFASTLNLVPSFRASTNCDSAP